ncbi:cytochrome c-type biogenesis protein CcsB [Desulfacinum infernum DSM 9756]|uniref:Cytochrome c-type biogenesis protein CcsB n=1 Tax=Desulfacinum infernum DSM 9756 TaxID=1121391 RepID=A0A1M5D3E2_9BACT|nr:c-type cytochrome biogenesis protein CcsB [Desulfacinum infernum]MBZ4658208.1 ccsB [Desulfacinum sp.]SHF61474.1 cytochrome c-type biogenesis protein CcsB [Desulfacinum infernum DSM 9756]
MESVLLTLAVTFYCVGTVGYLIFLVRDREGVHKASWSVLVAGALCHGAAIVLRSLEKGHLAVTTSPEALSFFAWFLVLAYLILSQRLRLRILGSFVSPLAAVFMFGSTLLPTRFIPSGSLFKSTWVVVHVAALFAANALFAVAFAAAIMYLLQERAIKQKRLGHLYARLPSLERLDRINHICLLIGFPLMTVGLLAGFLYASTVWKSPWNWDPKEIFALLTWLIYAVLLHERLAVGWRGRRAAWLAIFGFSAVLVTFLGVNLFLEGHHTIFVE